MVEEAHNQEVRARANIRAQFRSITGTSFILVLILVLAVWAHVVKPPIIYVLFALIFVVDFSLHAYLIWQQKIFWWSSMKFIEGGKARVVAVMYGFLALVCVAFAVYSLIAR